MSKLNQAAPDLLAAIALVGIIASIAALAGGWWAVLAGSLVLLGVGWVLHYNQSGGSGPASAAVKGPEASR